MELYIAGGCGEYGRNCFLVKGETTSFLVDCGSIPINGVDEVPHLTREQVLSIDCVFLTHSHSGHTGALPWLIEEMGYNGPIVATEPTFSQLPFTLDHTVFLEDICPGRRGEYQNISIHWGRSAHCRGAVWYHFALEGKSILFSGDYAEVSIVYAGDIIRHRTADFAVLDRGESHFAATAEDSFAELIEQGRKLRENHDPLLFPVPKYGFGAELLRWLHRNFPDVPCYMDTHLMKDLEYTEDRFWYKSPPGYMLSSASLFTGQETSGFFFVSDPHLSTPESKALVDRVLSLGGLVIMTSSEPPHFYGAQLIESGNAIQISYPIHFDNDHYRTLLNTNNFKKAIPYHSPEHTGPETFTF